ncbi:MAG: YdcF family protein [Myxococcales bacterium]|nr:YdcF family protein [Myxococcales bacterium]
MIQFDAVVVLGKEMRHDPVRAMRELRARAAAAAAVHRATGATIATLEARLRGQARTGSQIVADLLSELGVPASAVYREDQTRSTREEVARTLELTEARSWSRILVVTARYHIPRVRRLFADELGACPHTAPHVAVHGPPALLRCSSAVERSWILAGEPTEETMTWECRAEFVLSTLARALQPLPFRRELEVRAGAWLRGATER